ncbi:MAG: transglycosylase domain-containing protein, partial [Thermodesulfobacteriota bacterium]
MPRRKTKKRSFSKFLINTFFFLGIVGMVSLFAAYKYFANDLPDLKDITGYEPTLVNEFYSSNGTLVAEYGIEKRKLVDLEDIPDHVIDAFIAIEDKRFYEHQGFDLKGIFRAVVQNTIKGEVVSGASTITQQVTKNLVLSSQKTYTRKIKELILSYRIEKNLTKKEILYLYLNQIYLADGNYGVQAASQNFFGKDIGEIGIAEAAILAGIPKRPEYYSPRKNLKNALSRQKTVLNIM